MTANPDGVRLLALAEQCAKYDFDTVEMIQCKWQLWEEILAALRAAPVPQRDAEPVAWCQPMDNGKPTPRKFLIYFEDRDRGIAIYEGEARKAFEQLSMAWNCYLFGALPLAAPPALPAGPEPMRRALESLKNSIDTLLNDVLCEMKPNYDDSQTGFNEAWDIVRACFKRALSPSSNGKPERNDDSSH